MAGKRGLIMGVANERSIAWGIAQALHAAGAELAFTYQGAAFGKRVLPMVEKLGSKIVEEADVENEESLDRLFARLKKDWGRLDFVVHAIAFSDKEELKGRYVDTTKANFQRSLTISCYSFTEIARRALPLMTEGGSLITLTYEGAVRVMPSYNVMGVAKAAPRGERALSGGRSRPAGRAGQRPVAGPMRTLAGAVIGSARYVYRVSREASPLRRNIELTDVGGAALYLLSDLSAGVTGTVHYVDAGYHAIGMPPAGANGQKRRIVPDFSRRRYPSSWRAHRLRGRARGQPHLDALAPTRVADSIAKDAVALVARLAGDIELAGEQAADRRRDLEVDVRRAAGIGDRLQRAEAVAAVGLRQHAAIALEGRVAPLAAGLARMIVETLRVALPDLDQRALDRPAVEIEHAALEMKHRAHRLRRLAAHLDEIVVHVGGKGVG